MYLSKYTNVVQQLNDVKLSTQFIYAMNHVPSQIHKCGLKVRQTTLT